MSKKLCAICGLLAAAVTVAGLVGCTEQKTATTYYTVTYYDATDKDNPTVLKTEQVASGSTASEYTPTKEGGYEFVDWFATPSKTIEYDFSSKVTGNVSVFAGFTKYTVDTRQFYIVGSGTSSLLYTSNWGKVITDDMKLTKAADKNEYTITLDLKKGDQFQFAIDSSWSNKRGFGYMTTTTLSDGTTAFSGEGSVYSDSAKGSNIKVELDGNYTLTLKTYPNEDYYNTSGTGYTEATKEVYNYGTYDRITWTRNGAVQETDAAITRYYIKGAGITKWKDMYNSSTMLTAEGSSHKLSVYLKEGEEFMFTSLVTKIVDGVSSSSVGATYIKAGNLDAGSKQYVSGDSGNITAKAAGLYTFTYNEDTAVLSVTFDSSYTSAACDYYIDGDIGVNGAWNAFVTSPNDYKMTDNGDGTYSKEVTLKAGNQIQIRSCAAGTAPTTSNTTLYQYSYMVANDAFSAYSADNENIKALKDGTYKITFDSYSKIITIE